MIEAISSRGDTRAKIIDVAARLLREHGPAALTTRAVAEGAGVQAPAIYRLFGDKEGLMDAVAEQVMATYVSAKAVGADAASADEVDPLDDLRVGWKTQIDFGLTNPTLSALLSDPARGLRSPATQLGKRVLESRVHRVALTGRLRVSEARAVELIRAAGTGAILTLLATPPERRDPGLADDLFDAVLSRIVTDGPGMPQGDLVPSAVTLRAIAPRLEMLSAAERQLLAEWLDRAIEAL